jgi:Zn-dependent oligopeptidase
MVWDARVLDGVAGVALSDVSLDNVVKPLADLDAHLEPTVTNVTLLKDLSTVKDVRDASVDAHQVLSEYDVKASMRVDVYQRVAAVVGNEALMTSLTPELKRFMEHAYRDARRLGLHLDDDTRKKIEDLKTRISKVGIEYQQAVTEVDTVLLFTAEELAGVWASVDAARFMGEIAGPS